MSSVEAYFYELKNQLRIPYPERFSFLKEIRQNYEECFHENLKQGLEVKRARKLALKSIRLDSISKVELEEVHSSSIYKSYWLWPKTRQNLLELFFDMMPLLVIFNFFIQEVPMISLINQGGAAMYPILFLGTMALLWQGRIVFSWFIAKNHSSESLKLDPSHALSLGGASFLLGLFGSLLGLYKSFHYVNAIEDPNKFQRVLVWGISESIVGIIFATGFLSIIFCLHFLIRNYARIKNIPV